MSGWKMLHSDIKSEEIKATAKWAPNMAADISLTLRQNGVVVPLDLTRAEFAIVLRCIADALDRMGEP